MKKHLFSLALGALTLTACTSEEIVDVNPVQGKAIKFENVVDKSSRAIDGDLTNATFDNFLVYGYYTVENMSVPIQIFNGVPVTKKVEDGKTTWTYDGTRFWVPGSMYYFYAYSCADVALSQGKGSPVMTLTNESSVDGRALTILEYLCDGTHQHDLVCAESENNLAKTEGNQQVSLEFKHALCKIKAVFATDFPAGYDVKISEVKLAEYNNVADYNVGTSTWSNFITRGTPTTALTLDEDNNVVSSSPKNNVETAEIFVIPKKYPSNEFVKLHFRIEVSKDGELVLQRDINGTWSPQWEAAHIYRYNINISGSVAGVEPIVFAASQKLGENAWGSSTDVNMVFGVDAPPASDE